MAGTRFCDDEVSDKSVYKTFARTKPANSEVAYAVVEVFKQFGWTRCSIVSSDDPNFVGITNLVLRLFQESVIEVTNHHIFPGGYIPHYFIYKYEEWYHVIENLRKNTRIYLFIGKIIHHRDFILHMYRAGVYDNQDSIVVATSVEHMYQGLQGYSIGWYDTEDDELAREALRYSLLVEFRQPLADFDVYNAFAEEYARRTEYIFGGDGFGDMDNKAYFLYDAAMQLCRAMNLTLLNGGNIRDASTVMSYILNSTYQSEFGREAYINENGDAIGVYDLKSWRLYDMVTHFHFGKYFEEELTIGVDYGMVPIAAIARDSMTQYWVYDDTLYGGTIDWPGGQVPLDMPPCGFFNELCPTTDLTLPIVLPLCGVLLCTGLAIFYVYRKRKYEAELDSVVWKIHWDDLNIRGDHRKSQALSMKSMIMSTVSLIHNQEEQQIFTKVASYKGNICAIKAVNKHHIDLNRTARTELKEMRDMHHDNVNKFIGACVDRHHICILMEYCPKGSLQDILENDDMKLDHMFLASLIADLMKGMIYIHAGPIKSHGNLKSSNCVVDHRWVLQITDYGLHEFKKGQLLVDDSEYSQYSRLLWTAPEHLRQGKHMPQDGSQKGDVYSFSIILQEIYARAQPYHLNEEDPHDIIKKVKAGSDPPYRPDVSDVNEVAPECVLSTMRQCWDEDPNERPDFLHVRELLKPLQEGLKSNILDNMITLMERYTNNLEELIEERTDDVKREKKKIDSLLNRMLPPSISRQLMKGVQVEPEVYETATLFFSDIVGFTKLSAASTPIQVVNMLNDLYTLFDSTVANYDVYKVETIGDAYVLVSGLPIRNGINHAGQIASAAWHLLEGVQTFQVPHRPDVVLQLRIGIHSGYCVAGVVGLKMPRYCLFGDTVNAAARMESSGLPMEVHVSPECKGLLDQIGGYTLEERGLVNIPGTGEIVTYWMKGQDLRYKVERK
ncbi:speract receptor-like [Ptychodera flava]|uniref:speract receptor-like n=1 Tax=Ptychodera flava TaxID=63121 RepID=UPI003969BF77